MNRYTKNKYEKQGPQIVKALNSRKFEAYYVSTNEEAINLFLSLISKDLLISWGGSETIKELGLIDYLKRNNYKCLDRDCGCDNIEREVIMKQALLSDVFLMSSNAISANGCLINIDGLGNRISALSFGPKNVFVFAGMNKITKDVQSGISRAQEIAAVTNVNRFNNKNTYCSMTGFCNECLGSDCICSQILITRFSKIPNRIKVILIGEDLGF